LQEPVAARRGCAQAALPGERHVGPVQRQSRLDEPELLQLVASYLGGESVAELARQFELHESTVHEYLNRLEIPKHPYRKVNPHQVAEAVELYRDDATW
jgi:transposase